VLEGATTIRGKKMMDEGRRNYIGKMRGGGII